MLELVTKVWFEVLTNLLQLVVSSILSLFVYIKLDGRVKLLKPGFINEMILISGVSLLGVLLPLDTFAVLPVLFVLLKAGLREYTALPVIVSNMVFNMLVPFTDPSFIWKTGYRRAIAAFLLGLAAGVLLRSLSYSKKLSMMKKTEVEYSRQINLKSILNNLNQVINITGIYLLIGVLLNTIFYKFIFYNLIDLIFTSPKTAFLPLLFAGYNVVHPLFLLAINIAYSLLNITNLSAAAAVLKPKGLILYMVYFTAWPILLGFSMFIHQ